MTNVLGRRKSERMVMRLAQAAGSDLLTLAYHSIGILKYEDAHISGEHYLISEWLPGRVGSASPTLFDVGANDGEYSAALRQQFPEASIYAFEPNINAYEIMNGALSPLGVRCLNLGLSSKAASGTMYTYANEAASKLASVYREVLTNLHGAEQLRPVEFKTTTLDEFCAANGIDHIDFIKIDTEGHEWEVLSGAKGMVAAGKIQIIQFEFNEMNIISRVFLKDFYDFLKGYSFYRLDTDGLIPLGGYSSTHEIFKFQNILAIKDGAGQAR